MTQQNENDNNKPEITYKKAIQILGEAEKNSQGFKNTRSAVKKHFLKVSKVRFDGGIGAELLSEETFKENLEKIKQRMGDGEYYKNVCRLLNHFRDYILKLIHSPSGEIQICPWQDKIKQAIKKLKLTHSKLARKVGCSACALEHLLDKTNSPRQSQKKRIAKLLEEVKLPSSVLNEVIYFDGKFLPKLGTYRSALSNWLAQKKHNYAFRFKNWPEACQIGFNKYVDYKQKEFTAEEGDLKRHPDSIWTFNSQGECHSKETFQSDLEYLFGYLMLDKEQLAEKFSGKGLDAASLGKIKTFGMKETGLSLGLAGDAEKAEGFIGFAAFRVGENGKKMYTSRILTCLDNSMSLLRKDTGYIRQQPKLFKKNLSQKNGESWEETCDRHLKKFQEMRKNYKKLCKKGRDPFKHLHEILAEPEPLKEVLKIIKDYEEKGKPCPTASPRAFAVWFMYLVIMKLLTIVPLRARQLCNMLWDPENSSRSNLVRKQDGTWWVRFNPEDFKNRKYVKEEFWVKLPSCIYSYIEKYLNEYRPILTSGTKIGPLFPNATTKIRDREKVKPLSPDCLYDNIRKITRTFGTLVPAGFGPHAFRHIVATHFIKQNPGAYPLVAALLNDSLAMTMKYYARFDKKSAYDVFIPQFETLVDEVKNGKAKSTKRGQRNGA